MIVVAVLAAGVEFRRTRARAVIGFIAGSGRRRADPPERDEADRRSGAAGHPPPHRLLGFVVPVGPCHDGGRHICRGRASARPRSLAASESPPRGNAAAIAVAVATTRVFLGVHWMTDVLAGLAMGWAWFAITSIAFGGRVLSFGQPVEVAERADAALPDPVPEEPASHLILVTQNSRLTGATSASLHALHRRAIFPATGLEANAPREILVELSVERRHEVASIATTLISSSRLVDRALRLAEPMLATMPSTVMIFACNIEGWNAHIVDAPLEQGLYARFARELHESLVGVRARERGARPPRRARPRLHETFDDLGVGNEVRSRDAEPVPRDLAERAEQREHVAVARLPTRPVRTARSPMPAWGCSGKRSTSCRRTIARRSRPSCRETRRGDRRPTGPRDPEMRVAPFGRVARIRRATRRRYRRRRRSRSPRRRSRTLRWVRWLISLGRNRRSGRNQRTTTPASCIVVTRDRSIGLAPHASRSTRTRTPARARSASPCGELPTDGTLPIDEREEVDRARERRSIASSIAGKISSPLRKTSTCVALGGRNPDHAFDHPAKLAPPYRIWVRHPGSDSARRQAVIATALVERRRLPPVTRRISGSECSTFSGSWGSRFPARTASSCAAVAPPNSSATAARNAHSNNATMPAKRSVRLTERLAHREERAEADGDDEPERRRDGGAERQPRQTPVGGGAASNGKPSSSPRLHERDRERPACDAPDPVERVVVDRVADRMPEGQQRERADHRTRRPSRPRASASPYFCERRTVLFDAVDPVDASFDLSEQRAAGDERADAARTPSPPSGATGRRGSLARRPASAAGRPVRGTPL